MHRRSEASGRRYRASAYNSEFQTVRDFLVNVWPPQNGEFLDPLRQGNGPSYLRSRSLGGIHDLARRLIEDAVIERFKAYADILTVHSLGLSKSRGAQKRRR